MPLFRSKKSKNHRLFDNAMVMAVTQIEQRESDESRRQMYRAWVLGASVTAATLAEDKHVKLFWRAGTQKNADSIVKLLIPAMMSRYYWGRNDQTSTTENQKREFDEHLSNLFLEVFGVPSTEFDTYLRNDFLNLNVQFNYECDWLQGKVTASESDGSRWIWDVLQFPDAYQLTDEQDKYVPFFFDLQYSLLSSLAKGRLVHHEGTPIFFEFLLWLDLCAGVFGDGHSIQWSVQRFPIQGAKQLVARGSSTLGQLTIEDFVLWCGAVRAGTEAMLR